MWPPKAQATFDHLKQWFIIAPSLIHPTLPDHLQWRWKLWTSCPPLWLLLCCLIPATPVLHPALPLFCPNLGAFFACYPPCSRRFWLWSSALVSGSCLQLDSQLSLPTSASGSDPRPWFLTLGSWWPLQPVDPTLNPIMRLDHLCPTCLTLKAFTIARYCSSVAEYLVSFI